MSDRRAIYKEGGLPYSFNYKIRTAFVRKHCPICNCVMDYSNNLVKPTIQHIVPISKGGKHQLGNIAVVCMSCNTSIQDKETGILNAKEVIEVWNMIKQRC